VTVRRLLADGEECLRRAGVESPADAQWLMAAVLGCRRGELPLRGGGILENDRRELWKKWLDRRRGREPLQHILGHVPFAGVDLAVDGRALIPRPETEELIVHLIDRLGNAPPRSILDLGTGTGACILALAAAFPKAVPTACDIDGNALELARSNARRCGMGERVRFVQSDWFASLSGTWDLIVANPPYLSPEEWERTADEVRLHEPPIALISGMDGTAAARHILAAAGPFLSPGGLLAMEIGESHGAVLRECARGAGWKNVAIRRDLEGRERHLIAEMP
jgi:release factor glutamine methyltransferase